MLLSDPQDTGSWLFALKLWLIYSIEAEKSDINGRDFKSAGVAVEQDTPS